MQRFEKTAITALQRLPLLPDSPTTTETSLAPSFFLVLDVVIVVAVVVVAVPYVRLHLCVRVGNYN